MGFMGDSNGKDVCFVIIDCFPISRFKDRLLIDIEESSSITVELSAEGHGSTIVSDPPISPVLDLKSKFWLGNTIIGL